MRKKSVPYARIRPEMNKQKAQVMIWPDHREVLAELGEGSVSGGIAVLVARHLKKPLPKYGRAIP